MAWGAIVVFTVAPFVTPGVGHVHVGRIADHGEQADVATPSEIRTAAGTSGDIAPVVVYRRRGALSRRARQLSTPTTLATEGELAHHAPAADHAPALVHSHGAGGAHVHYSILGLEFSLPAPQPIDGHRSDVQLARADGVEASPVEETSALDRSDEPRLAGATVTGPSRGHDSRGDAASDTFFRHPLAVELPTGGARERLALSDPIPTSPDLSGDDPVPRLPRV